MRSSRRRCSGTGIPARARGAYQSEGNRPFLFRDPGMDQIAGEQSRAAIFAADGKARHRLVRAAVAAGVALLGSWLIALALGVLGGFGSLPDLPGSQSKESTTASGQVQQVQPSHRHTNRAQTPDVVRERPAPAKPTSTPAPVRHVPSPSQRQSSTPKTTSKAPASPSTPAAHGTASHGRALG